MRVTEAIVEEQHMIYNQVLYTYMWVMFVLVWHATVHSSEVP